MGDLISRSALNKFIAIKKAECLHCGNKPMEEEIGRYNPSSYIAGFIFGVEMIQGMIKDQPTAYDVDKVVEELQVEKKKPWIVLAERNGYARAIDIVKRGSRDE